MQSAGCGTQSCQVGANGCTAWATLTSSCAAPLVCERYAGPSCLDPNWAEWPVPTAPGDNGVATSESYTDNGDGTILDNVTKLVWQKSPPANTYTQQAAIAYCAGSAMSLGEHTDWRLPTIVELFSLSRHGAADTRSDKAINPIFPSPPGNEYWSSTPLAESPSSAYYVSILQGSDVSTADVTASKYVRCVR